MNHLIEEKKNLPIAGEYDVIVCGAGPAGISAAIASGRMGVRTLLIESGGCLGGIWTMGLLSFVLDNSGKGGIMEEIRSKLDVMGGYLHDPHPDRNRVYDGSMDFTYDAEVMKLLLEELCTEANVEVLLHSRVAGVLTENSAIKAVISESYSGRRAHLAKIYVDCTGNGEVAAQAGCSYDVGHPQTGKTQPATMLMIVSGIPKEQTATKSKETKAAFRSLLNSVGVEPSYKNPTVFRLPHPDLACIMLNHEYEVNCNSIEQITLATMHGRQELKRAVQALSKLQGWENIRLVSTAEHIGLREGRRIHGLYKVTIDDLISGARFPDPICTVKLPVDVHAVDPTEEFKPLNQNIAGMPYHIPYRSLVSKDMDNLAMAGRCVSGDFFAHASYRVTGNSVPMGEAAGIAAAMAAMKGCKLAEVDGQLITQEMVSRGYEI